MSVKDLDGLAKEELIRWFMYKLRLTDRAELMERYPQHYNKLVDATIVETVRLCDREEK